MADQSVKSKRSTRKNPDDSQDHGDQYALPPPLHESTDLPHVDNLGPKEKSVSEVPQGASGDVTNLTAVHDMMTEVMGQMKLEVMGMVTNAISGLSQNTHSNPQLAQADSDDSDQENSNSNEKESKLTDKEQFKKPEKSSLLEVSENIKSIKKPKIDIWNKVTVGDLFEAALERYLIRKQSRTTWP